ncbi:MAG: hypothetical protein FWD11_10370 [Micrococcales bacterium]|nr:hypothetical protein [Micrococcales bacterium]
MRLILRIGAAVLLAGGSLTASALAATAHETDPCGSGGKYMPGVGCVMAVSAVAPQCDTDVRSLAYTLSVPVPAEKVTVSFTDGRHSGDVTGSPTGSVAWPAAVTGKNATVTFTTQTTPAYTASVTVKTPCGTILDNPDRPGREDAVGHRPGQVDAEAGSASDGARSPKSAPAANKSVPKSLGGRVLAATGAMIGPVVGVAAGLLAVGSLVYFAAKRRSV